MERYRKFVAALVGAAATSALAIWTPDTVIWKLAAVLAAVATAAAVFAFPNEVE